MQDVDCPLCGILAQRRLARGVSLGKAFLASAPVAWFAILPEQNGEEEEGRVVRCHESEERYSLFLQRNSHARDRMRGSSAEEAREGLRQGRLSLAAKDASERRP